MYKPVTIKDIALALKLSTSTVSRALRDSYEIRAETRKLVMSYAKEVNYQSNPIALGLKTKRSHSIGIVVPQVANSFFSQAIAGIELIAYEKGYHTIITQTHESSEREMINVNHLAQRAVDGLLISMSSGTTNYRFLKKLHEDNLPIVFFDRIVNEIDTFKVTSDNFSGAYQATEALIKKGRKRIGILANAPQLSITKERLAGYKKALRDNQIPFRTELVKNCHLGGSDQNEIDVAVKELFVADARLDAVFVCSDQISISCVRAFKKLNLDKRDIALAGFSNSEVVDLFNPSFLYVKQPAFEMGKVAVEMLIKLIESKYPIHEFETTVLNTELFEGGI